jgi:hypothetical protein
VVGAEGVSKSAGAGPVSCVHVCVTAEGRPSSEITAWRMMPFAAFTSVLWRPGLLMYRLGA